MRLHSLTRLAWALALTTSGIGCAPHASGPAQAPQEPSAVRTPTTIVSPQGAIDVVELLAEADREFSLEHYDAAASLYARVVENDLGGEYRARALLGWGTSLDLDGKPSEALGAYDRYLGSEPPGPERDRIAVRGVRLLTFLERYDEAESRARRLDLSPRAPLERVALLSARALGALSRGREADAEQDLARAGQELDRLGADHADKPPLDYAAWAFARGELLRLRGARIVFDPPPADFSATLEARCQALLDAQGAYSDAMRAESAHYSAMAGVRVASLYGDLHRDLMAMPLPSAADTPERRQLFEAALRLRYAILVDKAVNLLTHTLALVERTGEGQDWSDRAAASLEELRRQRDAEQAALARLPYSRSDLERALTDLGKKKK